MKIGLIGLQNSGKTTIFNALTELQAEVNVFSNAKAEPNIAIVEVGDERVGKLTEMYLPKKTTFATIELIDFVGLSAGSAKEGTFSSELLNLIKTMDALTLVVKNFKDDLNGDVSPLNDINLISDELLLFDLIFTETRLERIAHQFSRGKKTNELVFEEKTLNRILDHLNENKPLRTLELSADEERVIRGYQYLTQKPFLAILNSGEDNFGNGNGLIPSIQKTHDVIEFAGSFEMELAQLENEDDEKMFMDEMGIKESARNRLTKFAYEMLGYISFFTVGSDEVRAWTIQKGDSAVQAAGAIHTDLMRGFIRAECFSYEALIQAGSEKAVKSNGTFRLEGKNYVVQDGDVLSIRFNV
ncbi:redox-regulated ATPase YchF [candidate division KSB1 bacterium]|nr:redox-regulated ATPase YchF [candidate division KSB1 bacterium]MBL7095881.1 redox-regulated ATPase YchF [candidate division KSB1 bacterium]